MICRGTLVLLMAAGLAACRYGTPVEAFPPAQGPAGVTLRLGTPDRGLRGELLGVRLDGLVLLVGGQIWLIDYGSVESADVEDYPEDFGLGSGRAPGIPERTGLGRLARFPQGISPMVLDRLFQVHAQTRFRTLDDL
jgi:hypothetical protein